MKKTKILVPAAGLLLLSTAASVTGTVAWFSMNTTVSATGLAVQVKSDNTYLLISDVVTGDTAAEKAASIQSAGEVEVDYNVSSSDAKVYPSAPCLTAAEAAYLPASTGKKVGGDAITVAGAQVTDAATAALVTNWYTATAETTGDEAMLSGSARQLTAFTGYVITKTAYLTVSVGANNANNLSVTASFTAQNTGNIDAARVLITTDDGGFCVIKGSDTGGNLTKDIKGTNTAITSTTIRTVNIYVYVDGNDESVYTENMAALDGANISLSFNVSAVAAA